MPTIRFVSWNIENLSSNKTGIAGMANNLARVIVDLLQADVVIITEVVAGSWMAAMTALSNAANQAAVAAGGAATDYTGWLVSYATGGEMYGVLIRDLGTVRPIVAEGLAGADTPANPALDDLDKNTFLTWPNAFPGAAPSPLPAPGARPQLPLIDVYATNPRKRKRGTFPGRPLNQGGYSLGRGFRIPCLVQFAILVGGNPYVVPAVVCHLAAIRSGRNGLAQGQIRQYMQLHIAQKFQNLAGMPNESYINLDGTATRIQELMFLGDFNVDFLEQSPPLAPNKLRETNRDAYNSLTPSSVNSGSAAPAAAPGPAPGPPAMVPFAMPAGGWPGGPDVATLPELSLKAADTATGTILKRFNPAVTPPNTAALRSALFDDLFVGGSVLGAVFSTTNPSGLHLQAPAPQDAATVLDVPAQIVQAGGVGLDVSAAWLAKYPFNNTLSAPALAPGAAPTPLTANDQLIGARLISDHLPVAIDVTFS